MLDHRLLSSIFKSSRTPHKPQTIAPRSALALAFLAWGARGHEAGAVCRSWNKDGCFPAPAVSVWPQPREMSVGTVRALRPARTLERSIATNVMDALPGTSTSFVHLSVPSNKTNWKEKSNVPNVAPSFRPDEIDFVRGAVERFRRFANVGAVWVGPDEPMPVAVLAVAAKDPEFPAHFQMWRNVRGCFELVLQHEETARRRFSFVSRIRPDAVFFSSWVLPPDFAQLGGMFIPKGGLGCSTCANDHLALVPRAAAHRYFRDIFEEYSACKNGTCASIHRKGFARRPSHPFAPPRGGASYVYHAVGLEILPTHIPYALANHELAYTGENLTLGCHRLSVHSDFRHRMPYEKAGGYAVDNTSFADTIRNLRHLCGQWSCADS